MGTVAPADVVFVVVAVVVVVAMVAYLIAERRSTAAAARVERKLDALLRYQGIDTVIDTEGYIEQGAPLDPELLAKFAEWRVK